MKDQKKEAKPGRTNRKYPVELRQEVKALSVKVEISMEDLEIIFIKYGVTNYAEILEIEDGNEN